MSVPVQDLLCQSQHWIPPLSVPAQDPPSVSPRTGSPLSVLAQDLLSLSPSTFLAEYPPRQSQHIPSRGSPQPLSPVRLITVLFLGCSCPLSSLTVPGGREEKAGLRVAVCHPIYGATWMMGRASWGDNVGRRMWWSRAALCCTCITCCVLPECLGTVPWTWCTNQ